MKKLIDKLEKRRNLTDEEFLTLLSNPLDPYLSKRADAVRREHYSNKIYIRGLIEISNFCKNNCLYCGIRRDNKNIDRYRLSKAEILDCCDIGYSLGFRTFVMQSGEDNALTDEFLVDIISSIKAEFPDVAVTLSLGERSYESFKKLYNAGADRYLLRHEAAEEKLYSSLHPSDMSLKNRMECLFNLKKIGYQTGSGFMVGAPEQSLSDIIKDIRFLQKLNPEMIGIGPFIPHKDTPFSWSPAGAIDLTLKLISIFRLIFPSVLLPATTALATLSPDGRKRAIESGANVIMPNLSPEAVRDLYSLYDNKLSSGSEAAEEIEKLKSDMEKIGYRIVTDRGDYLRVQDNPSL